MFKTDDRVIQICLFLAGLIFMMYAGLMAFNTGFFIERYPTFDNDATNRYFIVWFGLNNIMFLSGIYYMGYKGLNRGYFVFTVPAQALTVIWIIMAQMRTGGDNYTGLILVILSVVLLMVARLRMNEPFSYAKADVAWGTSDSVARTALYGSLALQLVILVGYFLQPNGLMENNPNLEVTEAGSHFALGLTFLNVSVLIALLYQLRTGFNGVLITMGLVWHIMFISIVMVNVATSQGLDNGDPLLALAITLGFIFSATAFFRLQKSF